jgi:radical SAM/Cys-rich protein
MTADVLTAVEAAARTIRPSLIDITGGAPELHPGLRGFIVSMAADGLPLQVRTNLTVLSESGLEDMPEFFRRHRVALVASMPCYLEENVRAQRGPGVYERSVDAIKRLNALGYGREPELQLNLVYNPGGPFLPGPQADLEAAYRTELRERFDIAFSKLLTITNMPIGRFARLLEADGRLDDYRRLLRGSFNLATVPGLMCLSQIEVGWDGSIYDCDFNLALGLKVDHGAPDSIARFDLDALAQRRVVTGEHCFGCTAGAGSSCKGALV